MTTIAAKDVKLTSLTAMVVIISLNDSFKQILKVEYSIRSWEYVNVSRS